MEIVINMFADEHTGDKRCLGKLMGLIDGWPAITTLNVLNYVNHRQTCSIVIFFKRVNKAREQLAGINPESEGGPADLNSFLRFRIA